MLIALVGLLVYSNTFNVPFVFDDRMYIEENPMIKDSRYLFHPSDSDILRLRENVKSTRKTRSMGYLSFFLNYKLHGLKVTGYHAVNLLIHILNSLLVYFLVILTFKTPFLKKSTLNSKYIALFTGLLFVAHPIQTQAVTYICQRFASLVTFFYLLSVLAYIRSRLSESNAQRYALYALSLISAVLAMKTKENAFTLPLAVALYELMFLEESFKKRVLYLLPLLLTMLIIPLSVIDFDKPVGEAIGEATRTQLEISRSDYLLTQFRVLVTYLRLLALPVNQNLDYDYPVFDSFFNPQVFLSFFFLLSLLCLSVYLLRRSRKTEAGLRLIAFGVLWFFITLSVESSLIPIADVIFEHRVYLPSVGTFVALSMAIFLITQKGHRIKIPALIGSVLIIVILLGTAYARNIVWRSEISLWEDVVRKSPDITWAHVNLGISYRKAGMDDKAIQQYEAALQLSPDFHVPYNNLGNLYLDRGFYDKAIYYYQAALRRRPNYAEAHHNLGLVYSKKGMDDKAKQQYQEALRINPNFIEAHNELGILYRKMELPNKANKEFEAVRKLNPDYFQTR